MGLRKFRIGKDHARCDVCGNISRFCKTELDAMCKPYTICADCDIAMADLVRHGRKSKFIRGERR